MKKLTPLPVKKLLELNGRDLITNAYVRMLHRLPDPQGEAAYMEKLRRGFPPISLLSALRFSPEGKTVREPVKHSLFLRIWGRLLGSSRIWGKITRYFYALRSLSGTRGKAVSAIINLQELERYVHEKFDAFESKLDEKSANIALNLQEQLEAFESNSAKESAGITSKLHEQLAFIKSDLESKTNTVEELLKFQQDITLKLASYDNLVQSVPVTLRHLQKGKEDLDKRITELTNSLKSVVSSLEQYAQDAQRIDNVSSKLDESIGNFDSRLNGLVQNMEQDAQRIGNVSNKLDESIGAFESKLNNVVQNTELSILDSKSHIGNIWQTNSRLWERLEFMRRELLWEMRYSRPDESKQIKIAAQIISEDKIKIARRTHVRLNLGCGHIPLEDYINVDIRELPGVDIVTDVKKLPFFKEEVDEIFSAHLLEHFPQEQLQRELLPYWSGLLRKSGVFRAVVPDAKSMMQGYMQGEYPYDYMREVFFGGQDYTGDFHYNMFIPEQLEELLREVNLFEFTILAQGRSNGKCFEMEIQARKG